MKKQSMLSIGSAADDKKAGASSKKNDDAEGIDLDRLGALVQKEIEEVYRIFGGDDLVMETKSTIEILMDIESRFLLLTETIIHVCKNSEENQKINRNLENQRKSIYKTEQLELR